jgi:hypothetical protein
LEAAFTALPPDIFDPVVLAAVDHLVNDSKSITIAARLGDQRCGRRP